MTFNIKKILLHGGVIVGFIIIALAYFSPVLQGKKLFQSDIMQYTGMSKQQKDFRAKTGEETYWTNAAFAGMPTYQLGAKYPHNYIRDFDVLLRFLPRPADYLFLYFVGFYILLLVLKVDFKLAFIGALAFGFSTYLIIILGVGHNSKAHAIAYMPLVLSGVILTFRKQYVFGFLLTALAMGLELQANHFQMTYYLMWLILILGICYFIDAYKKKLLPEYLKTIGVLTVAVIFSVGLNATNILATKEYVKESKRGKSELTINPDGSPKALNNGLDYDYITQFSYGYAETFNLFIPRFMGGGNGEDVGNDSATYNAFRKLGATTTQASQEAKRAPMYWGEQPIVEAPAYIGAVVIFLFVLGLFLVKGKLKWWLVSGTVFSLLLSYGKNLSLLTGFFIEYVPLYNKFRAVTSIQVLLELCVPILSIMALVRLFNADKNKAEKLKILKKATLITGGVALLFLVFKSTLFDFIGLNDNFYAQNYGNDFVNALKTDRKYIFTIDTIRSLVYVCLAAALLYFFLKEKIKQHWVIVGFGVLILCDLVGVDKRYVNNDDFVPAIDVEKPFVANQVDNAILKDTTYYRVYDLVSGPSKPSYFHNSLTGYNAAELRRYNDIFNFYIAQNNMEVLNLFNTKYIITKDEKGSIFPYVNDKANGNAWFIKKFKVVNTANDEILALNKLDNKTEAVLNTTDYGTYFKNNIPEFKVDSTAQVKLVAYAPNKLTYKTQNPNPGFVVFSEVYYSKGWQVFLDNQEVPFIRVDYVLRGMEVPAGNHTISFKFNPQVVKTGSAISLASSLIFGIILLLGLAYQIKNNTKRA